MKKQMYTLKLCLYENGSYALFADGCQTRCIHSDSYIRQCDSSCPAFEYIPAYVDDNTEHVFARVRLHCCGRTILIEPEEEGK